LNNQNVISEGISIKFNIHIWKEKQIKLLLKHCHIVKN
jgi:hypothetical protein